MPLSLLLLEVKHAFNFYSTISHILLYGIYLVARCIANQCAGLWFATTKLLSIWGQCVSVHFFANIVSINFFAYIQVLFYVYHSFAIIWGSGSTLGILLEHKNLFRYWVLCMNKKSLFQCSTHIKLELERTALCSLLQSWCFLILLFLWL